jgi:uncharacterized protein (DUF58 family)
MKQQTRITLRREGWYYLIVLVFVLSGASLRQINLLMVIAGMMFGPLLINLLTVFRSLRAVEVSRHLPRQITAGQPLSVEIRLERPAKSARFLIFRPKVNRAVMVEDTIRRTAPSSEPRMSKARVLFTSLAAGQQESLHYMGRIEERGLYEFGPLAISTSWPFGLFAKTVTVPVHDQLAVYPRPGRLAPRWHQVMREAHAGTHYTRGQLGQQEGDFYGLRDYRDGDSKRWIHWRTSARRGSLFVQQYEQSRSQDLVLLIDLWRPLDSEHFHQPRIEQAIEFAATIVGNVCAKGGGHLSVATVGTRVERFDGPASTLLLSDILEHLAQLEPGVSPTANETDIDERLRSLIDSGLQSVTRRRNVVLISSRNVDRDDLYLATKTRDPKVLAAIGRCLCVSTDEDDTTTYFETGHSSAQANEEAVAASTGTV